MAIPSLGNVTATWEHSCLQSLKTTYTASYVQNGRHAIRFLHDTAPAIVRMESMLHRVPPPQQPITMMVVADAHGDCTISDNCFAAAQTDNGGSLTSFELCHGYPSVGDADRDHPRVCMHAGPGPARDDSEQHHDMSTVASLTARTASFESMASSRRVVTRARILSADSSSAATATAKLAVDRFPSRAPRLQPPPRDPPARGARGRPRPSLRPAASGPPAGRRGGRAPDGEAPAARQ